MLDPNLIRPTVTRRDAVQPGPRLAGAGLLAVVVAGLVLAVLMTLAVSLGPGKGTGPEAPVVTAPATGN